MTLWDQPVWDIRPAATEELRRLLSFLSGLTQDQWLAQSLAPGWSVKHLALHLLDDDLTWLSHQRDDELGGLVDMSDQRGFVEALAAKNQRFLDAAQEYSRRVVIDLLAWTGAEIDAFHAGCNLGGSGWVSWASGEPVPYWFNLAQEFTERWVHQQQMREAVDRVEDHADLLPDVLRTFVWAIPHQLALPDGSGAVIEVAVPGIATWTVSPIGAEKWALTEGPAEAPAATVTLSPGAAWRSFTGADVPVAEVALTGRRDLGDAVLAVRAAIV